MGKGVLVTGYWSDKERKGSIPDKGKIEKSQGNNSIHDLIRINEFSWNRDIMLRSG